MSGLAKKDPCKEKVETQIKLKLLNRELRTNIKECDDSLYGDFVIKYFTDVTMPELTHRGLLRGLFVYYRIEKKGDPNFSLTFQQFIDKFPRDQATSGTNFKKQHIFEALCRLLLLHNFDKGELGDDKEFINSLEALKDGKDIILNYDKILDLKVNESSKGGIVDILFRTDVTKKQTIILKKQLAKLYTQSRLRYMNL